MTDFGAHSPRLTTPSRNAGLAFLAVSVMWAVTGCASTVGEPNEIETPVLSVEQTVSGLRDAPGSCQFDALLNQGYLLFEQYDTFDPDRLYYFFSRPSAGEGLPAPLICIYGTGGAHDFLAVEFQPISDAGAIEHQRLLSSESFREIDMSSLGIPAFFRTLAYIWDEPTDEPVDAIGQLPENVPGFTLDVCNLPNLCVTEIVLYGPGMWAVVSFPGFWEGGWESETLSIIRDIVKDDSVVGTDGSPAFDPELESGIQFDSVTTVIDVGHFGSFTAQTDFVVRDSSALSGQENAVENLLRPRGVGGTIDVFTDDAGKTVFSVTVAGRDFDEFSDNFSSWLKNADLFREEVEGAGVFGQEKSYYLYFDFYSLLSRYDILTPPTVHVNVPPGVTLTTDREPLDEFSGVWGSSATFPGSGVVRFETSGTFIGALVLFVGGIGLLAVGLIIAVRRRAAIASSLRETRARLDEPLRYQGSDGISVEAYPSSRASLMSLPEPPRPTHPSASILALPPVQPVLNVRPSLTDLPLPPQALQPAYRVSLISGRVETARSEPSRLLDLT